MKRSLIVEECMEKHGVLTLCVTYLIAALSVLIMYVFDDPRYALIMTGLALCVGVGSLIIAVYRSPIDNTSLLMKNTNI